MHKDQGAVSKKHLPSRNILGAIIEKRIQNKTGVQFHLSNWWPVSGGKFNSYPVKKITVKDVTIAKY